MFNAPVPPNTASSPRIATITGRMKGAPITEIKADRPRKDLRDNARATGTAKTTLMKADQNACQIVNFNAAKSAADRAVNPPPRHNTAVTGPMISPATVSAAIIGTARCAMPQSLYHEVLRLRFHRRTIPFQALADLGNQQAICPRSGLLGKTSWLSGSSFGNLR